MNAEISIGELVKKIIKLIGTEAIIISEEKRISPENSEINRLLCDNTKIVRNTKWKPIFNLDSGLNETISLLNNNQEV